MEPMLYVIGDIHGYFDKLMTLMEHCRAHAGTCGEQARFVLLGDYVDRGPDSKSVLAYLAGSPPGVEAIRGNHEQMMLNALDDADADVLWRHNGGEETLASYGASTVRGVPGDHLDVLRRLPLFIDDGLRLFVHAGIDPADPAARNAKILLWTRKHPLDAAILPRFIVHGHTPTSDQKPDLRPNRLNLDTGAGYGRALTAGVFNENGKTPLGFIDNAGEYVANCQNCCAPAGYSAQ